MGFASSEFRDAVFSPSPDTRILFRFGDTILTNEDINLPAGVKFTEPFNLDEDLKMGVCPSATIETTFMNYHGLLSGFEFGECEVSLAARINAGTIDQSNANVVTVMRYDSGNDVKFEGYISIPYLKVNGAISQAQPPFAVHALLAEGNMLYCIGVDGQAWTALWDDEQGVLIPTAEIEKWNGLSEHQWDDLPDTVWNNFIAVHEINDFMTNKIAGWAANQRGLSYNGNILHEFYLDGRYETFEYVKLGVFIVDTPKKRRLDLISATALDRMGGFDIIADDFLDALTYPITLGEIFSRLCAFVGVPHGTITFINSTRVFNEPPLRTENVTAREVLGWIAEAACSYARMTRDGEVELAWFASDNLLLPFIFAADIAEYEVMKIDKLQILAAQTDIGVIIGTGGNAYQIMDNPYLYGATDNEIRTYGAPIYYRLSAFEPYSPAVVSSACDWSVRAGSVIQVNSRNSVYSLPIYRQTIEWHGGAARVTYESTGQERRPVNNKENRRLFQQGRAMNEISVTVEGFNSRITSAEGNVHELSATVNGFGSRITNVEGQYASLSLAVDLFSVNFVQKNGVISAINLSPETARIQAPNIQLEGIVTANNNFRIYTDGSMECYNATIGGSLNSVSGTFTSLFGSSIGAGGTAANPTTRLTANGFYVGDALSITTGRVQVGTTANGTLTTTTAFTVTYSGRTITLDATGLSYSGAGTSSYPQGEYPRWWMGESPSTSLTESGLYPNAEGRGNVGGGKYYPDQVKANSHPTASMTILKDNTLRLTPNDYAPIRTWNPITYTLASDKTGRIRAGFLAEELLEKCPSVVVQEPWIDDNGEEITLLSIEYDKLGVIALLESQGLWDGHDSLQEGQSLMKDQINTMQSSFDQLQSKFNQLQSQIDGLQNI